MRSIDLEGWVFRAVDALKTLGHVEDSLVELKAEWPNPIKAARQIAAHANAAHGSPILWIIGVDENRGVVGADRNELADWFAGVRSRFNQLYPTLQDLNVCIGDQTVVALLFETERAPFVVKNAAYGSPGAGSVEWEVPWREGRSTRTATRENLVRMLAPLVLLPEIECLDCKLKLMANSNRWSIAGSLYVYPQRPEVVVFPIHRCGLEVCIGRDISIDAWEEFILFAPATSSSRDSLTVDSSSTEVVVSGPGRVKFTGLSSPMAVPESFQENVSLTLTLRVAGAPAPSIVSLTLTSITHDNSSMSAWGLRKHPAL